MSLNNFIPTIWSASLLVNLRKSLVYGQPQIINRNYQGEITGKGDTVKINSIGRVNIFDYTKYSSIPAPQELNSATETLLISQAKGFNIEIDNIDEVQTNIPLMGASMEESAYALANVADQYVAGLYTGVATGNLIASDGSPYTPTVNAATGFNDAYDTLVDVQTKMNVANIPPTGRWVVVPPWYHGMLQKDTRFIGYGTPENRAALNNGLPWMNGITGSVSGLMVLVSNNVPNTNDTKYKIIAGHNMAWTFAEQLAKVRAYERPDGFTDGLKGLHVYGAAIIRPDALVVLTANHP